jgi:ParB-like chromosome segregation protein Spo0J
MAMKRLGAGLSSGKLATIGAAVAGELGDVTRQLETPLDRDRGVYDRVPLDSVAPDPENPRNLKLTWDTLREAVNALQQDTFDSTDPRRKVYETIAGLAATYDVVGQEQPISTYRDDRGLLRIIDGERRYWAARLRNWEFIDAKVKPRRPDYLRLEQYVANVQREDLSIGQHLNNLEMLVTEAQEQGRQVDSLNQLAAFIGRPRSTMQHWWGVLRGPEDVRSAVRADEVKSIEQAYTAAHERDPGRRAALLSGQIIPVRDAKSDARRNSSGGRPKTKVSLGMTKDLETIRRLITAIPLSERFDNVEWGEISAVQKAWIRFLKALEREVKSKQGAPTTE